MFSELKLWLAPWYNRFAVMALGAAAGIGAYNGICWSHLTASDWGTWISAIGTVATLVGTIYLAQTETRRVRREAQILARLHGASMSIRAANAHLAVMKISMKMELRFQLNRHADYLRELHTELSVIQLWNVDELVPLVPLPHNVAVKLAEATENVKMAVESLAYLEQRVRLGSSSAEDDLTVAAIKAMLRGATRFLDEAGKECRLCGMLIQFQAP